MSPGNFILQYCLLSVVLVVFVGFVYGVTIQQSERMLERWCHAHGYKLLSTSSSLFGGPFWYRKWRNQWVLQFTVELSSGETRTGHALCGDWLLGTLVDEVKVEWKPLKF